MHQFENNFASHRIQALKELKYYKEQVNAMASSLNNLKDKLKSKEDNARKELMKSMYSKFSSFTNLIANKVALIVKHSLNILKDKLDEKAIKQKCVIEKIFNTHSEQKAKYKENSAELIVVKEKILFLKSVSVSYTHLTLPTICSV
eukprot:TRINITY_DN13340_c0_g1_i1.p1 TRINITY_DN13340_c0_g1~~TRINITY_DN13340_c0_g1_i1.p1  ORF type:complete len:146 (+),score=14.44 TRINITY_DN13340_c0_g1_i1:217-654(+)